MFAFSKEPLSMLVNSGQLPALFSMCLCMCVFSISAFGRFGFISFIFLLCFGILEFAYVFSLFFLTINLFVYLCLPPLFMPATFQPLPLFLEASERRRSISGASTHASTPCHTPTPPPATPKHSRHFGSAPNHSWSTILT